MGIVDKQFVLSDPLSGVRERVLGPMIPGAGMQLDLGNAIMMSRSMYCGHILTPAAVESAPTIPIRSTLLGLLHPRNMHNFETHHIQIPFVELSLRFMRQNRL